MKLPTILMLSLISGHVDLVDIFGHLGRNVLISCHYSRAFTNLSKVVCSIAMICETKIKSEDKNEWVCDDKFCLYDDAFTNVIQVLIRDLSPQDAGPYRCAAVQDSAYRAIGDWVLKVADDPCCEQLKTITGLLGQTVSFSCNYPDTNKHNPKYLLKINDGFMKQMLNTTHAEWMEKRFSVSDNRTSNVFRVIIREVTMSDAGIYFCGVYTSGITISYVSLITNIQLLVTPPSLISQGESTILTCPYGLKLQTKFLCKEDTSYIENDNQMEERMRNTINEFEVTRQEKEKVTFRCRYQVESAKNRGQICRAQEVSRCDKDGITAFSEKHRHGRLVLTDDACAGVFAVTMSDLTEEDSGIYWCGEDSFECAIYVKWQLHVKKDTSSISFKRTP
ncbi:polymeric immunoglobulin receptor-like [Brachyhypopomus gauderio]|uniref:polymeric immunoglobulin receptor-like n=1 Tax=Brachyhypopomus gauderio TaxID=698409 RepID=UPI00404326D6